MGLNNSCFGWCVFSGQSVTLHGTDTGTRTGTVKWTSSARSPVTQSWSSITAASATASASLPRNRPPRRLELTSDARTGPRGLYKTSEMARDVYELLNHVGWTEPRSLYIDGVSMGGMIAQELVHHMPLRKSFCCGIANAMSCAVVPAHAGKGCGTCPYLVKGR